MNRLIVVFCVAFAAVPALAHWVENDGHKMHYPQMPDETGWDVNATSPVVLADDWLCTETGPVKNIHFWGSWRDVDPEPDGVGNVGAIESFYVRIYTNVPADPLDEPSSGPSHPGTLLWAREITDFGAVPVDPIDPEAREGWYDPLSALVKTADHDAYFQYNIVNISDPYTQEEGTIYWLSITANVAVEIPQPMWGWKSSRSEQFMDDAVWANPPPGWLELYEPPLPSTQSLDLAFVITCDWVQCDGTESGGTGVVDASCAPGTRLYAYPVQACRGNMTDLYIGTQDCDAVHYTNICMPSGWTFTLEKSMIPHDPGKTAHGALSTGPSGNTHCMIIWSKGAGDPLPAGGSFTFGFDHEQRSHDVGWEVYAGSALAATATSDWGLNVGSGYGPVHAPLPVIPAVSAWGLVVMLLLVVAAGTIVIRRRRAVVA